MTGVYILLGGIALFAVTITTLAGWARRREAQRRQR